MQKSIVRIVIVVALLAAAVAAALFMKERREAAQHRQREAAMRDALATMRDAIGSFNAANGRAPASLEELVKYGQLAAIPTDPVTRSADTWDVATEERVAVSDDFAASSAPSATSVAVIDVRSGAPGNDSSGKPWSSY